MIYDISNKKVYTFNNNFILIQQKEFVPEKSISEYLSDLQRLYSQVNINGFIYRHDGKNTITVLDPKDKLVNEWKLGEIKLPIDLDPEFDTLFPAEGRGQNWEKDQVKQAAAANRLAEK